MEIDLLSKNDILLESCDALQLQHNEAEFTLYAEIRGDVAIHDGDSLGFRDADGRYRIFEIFTRTLRQPDNIWIIDGIDKGVFELMGDPVEEKRARDTSVNDYVGRLLEGTRFTLVSTASGTGTMAAYYESVWSALVKVREVYGVRCVPYYTITGGLVTGRYLSVDPAGTVNRGRIFELGDDLSGLDITYDDSNIKTALYGRGRGVEIDGGESTEDPAYGRRLTFAEIVWSTSEGDPVDKPEGQEWIGDPNALAVYGRDGRHRFGFAVFDSTTDPDELIRQTWEALQQQIVPIISITGTVRDTERIMGRTHEAVRMHDTIMVRMQRNGAFVDITAAIIGIIRDYVDPDNTRITIGNALKTSGDVVRDLSTKIANYEGRAAVWDRANAFDLQGAMDVMNNQIRSTVGNWYTDPVTGAIMLVSSDGTKAMRLTGAGWQIASSKIGDVWQWRTAATGSGIVADQITTGTLSANLIKAGIISDVAGLNYWDMTTGEFQLSPDTQIGEDGPAIGDLAEDAITAVDVEYASGTSSDDAPTSGWSTDSPAWEPGKYIWQRTATTNGDGVTTYSDPACIQGAKGADGSGISSVTVTYGTSSSSSTMPSSWQTTIPTVSAGDFLWTRTITDYTDTSIQDTVTYTYSRQGENGQQGQPGTSVSVSSIKYQAGTSPTTAPTGTWADNPVSVADGQYLWTKTTFSDNSVAYGVARQGENGEQGPTGTGVSAVVEQYYLSTSDQDQQGGSWSTDQPVWVSGKYIWTRSAVTWTDSTTTYTVPVLAKAINGANQAVNTLDTSLNQQGVFNRLTNNGTSQGIYLSNENLYVNATYIGSGALSADRISAGSLSFGKLATSSVFSSVGESGLTVTHTSAGNAYTTLDANGIRIFNSSNALIGGLYVPTGQQAVKMGATTLMNPAFPNFSVQLDRLLPDPSLPYRYMLSFYRQNTFAFGIGMEDDPNFTTGFLVGKYGQAAAIDYIIDTAKNWYAYDPISYRPTAYRVDAGNGGMKMWQEGNQVYLNSPDDIYLIMHVNGGIQTLRMSDVYDIFHP